MPLALAESGSLREYFAVISSRCFNLMNVFYIQDSFILEQWTRHAKVRALSLTPPDELHVEQSRRNRGEGVLRYMTFVKQVTRYVHDMCSSAKANEKVSSMIMQQIVRFGRGLDN